MDTSRRLLLMGPHPSEQSLMCCFLSFLWEHKGSQDFQVRLNHVLGQPSVDPMGPRTRAWRSSLCIFTLLVTAPLLAGTELLQPHWHLLEWGGPEQCLVRIIDPHEDQFHQLTPITVSVTYCSSLYRNPSQIPFSHTEPNVEFLSLIPI